MIYNGAIDNQTTQEKAINYKFEEVVTAPAPVIWAEKPRETWRSFNIRNQDGSGTCVCQTYATELGIIAKQKYNTWLDFSSSFPYQQRTLKDVSGCTSTDIYSVFPKVGNIFESFMPSQEMNDEQVMAVKMEAYYKDLALAFPVKRIELPLDFETVASTIQATGKGVMVWFRFSMGEWTNIPQVLPQPTTSGHSVTAIDFTLINGKKYLIIQDSWGLQYADKGLRLISEEYFKARCFLASYLLTFKTEQIERPHFDGSIISAQKCFTFEGFFPSNVAYIENWGNVTRAACIKFQKKYNILPSEGNFGPLTAGKLRELYP